MAKTDGRSKSLSAVTETKPPTDDGAFVVTVDGKDYPLNPAALSALDEDRLRAVSRSKLTLAEVMRSISSGVGGLSDIAAFVYLAECQAGRAPVWEQIAGSITFTSEIDITDVAGDADPE